MANVEMIFYRQNLIQTKATVAKDGKVFSEVTEKFKYLNDCTLRVVWSSLTSKKEKEKKNLSERIIYY